MSPPLIHRTAGFEVFLTVGLPRQVFAAEFLSGAAVPAEPAFSVGDPGA